MAKLITTNQQLVSGVTYPQSGYSRVVGVFSQIKGFGVEGFGFTPPLGNTVRLYNITVYFGPAITGLANTIEYQFYFGRCEPTTAAEVKTWSRIIPIHYLAAGLTTISQQGKAECQSWNMNRLFVCDQIRFAVVIGFTSTMPLCEMYTFFEISEG